MKNNIIESISRAGILVSEEKDIKSILLIILEQALYTTRSDIACVYTFSDKDYMKLAGFRGRFSVPERLPKNAEIIEFIEDLNETIVINSRNNILLSDIFLNPEMKSAIAAPLIAKKHSFGVLILNSTEEDFYDNERMIFIDKFIKFSSNSIFNSKFIDGLNDLLQDFEGNHKFNKKIISAIPEIIIVLDSNDNIKFINESAEKFFGLSPMDIDKNFNDVFEKSISRNFFESLRKAKSSFKSFSKISMNYKKENNEIVLKTDISLIPGKTKKIEGLALFFKKDDRSSI